MSLVATFDVENDTTTTSAAAAAAAAAGRQQGQGRRRPLRHSIYLGGKVDAKDYDKLVNRWKITHILNVTPPKQTNIEAGVPNYFEKKQGNNTNNSVSNNLLFRYKRIPIYDAPTSVAELGSKHQDEIVKFIAKGLCHGNTLVHCSRGVSRSTTCVVLYLMAKKHYRYEAALEMIRRRRPQACPIPAFDEWLRQRDVHYHSLQERQEQQQLSQQHDAGNNENKKRKRTAAGAAAIGPCPPPRQPPQPIGPAAPPGMVATAIGPTLPPSTTESVGGGVTTDTTAAASVIEPSPVAKTIGPEVVPPITTTTIRIGPERPPAATAVAVETGTKHEGTSTATAAATTIGPELPP